MGLKEHKETETTEKQVSVFSDFSMLNDLASFFRFPYVRNDRSSVMESASLVAAEGSLGPWRFNSTPDDLNLFLAPFDAVSAPMFGFNDYVDFEV